MTSSESNLFSSLCEPNMSTFDDLPDEIMFIVFRKLTLLSLMNISKVNKRGCRLIQDFKPYVKTITKQDILDIAKSKINILYNFIDYDPHEGIVGAGHMLTIHQENKYDDWFTQVKEKKKQAYEEARCQFYDLFYDIVRCFPRISKIEGGDVICNIVKNSHFNTRKFLEKLGEINQNITSLFQVHDSRKEKYSGPRADMSIAKHYMLSALRRNPSADPCCDQILPISGIYGPAMSGNDASFFISSDTDLIKCYPHLTCKLSFLYYTNDFLDRQVSLTLDNEALEIIDHILPNVRVVSVNRKADMAIAQFTMSNYLPNLTYVQCYSFDNIGHIIDLCDFDSKVLKIKCASNQSMIGIDNLHRIYTMLNNPNRNLEMFKIISTNTYLNTQLSVEFYPRNNRSVDSQYCTIVGVIAILFRTEDKRNYDLGKTMKTLFPEILDAICQIRNQHELHRAIKTYLHDAIGIDM